MLEVILTKPEDDKKMEPLIAMNPPETEGRWYLEVGENDRITVYWVEDSRPGREL